MNAGAKRASKLDARAAEKDAEEKDTPIVAKKKEQTQTEKTKKTQ